MLDHVHRSKALREWHRLARGETVSLEKALGAFDLFVLHDQHGDLLEVKNSALLVKRSKLTQLSTDL